MAEHTYYYTDMAGLDDVLSELTHGNINKWTDLTRKLQESKDKSSVRVGMNRFEKGQPETIAIASDKITVNQKTMARTALEDASDSLNGTEFLLRNYTFSTNTHLEMKISQLLKAVDYEGDKSFIPEKIYAVEVSDWGYEKKQNQKLFAGTMDKIIPIQPHEPKALSFLQHYLNDDFEPAPLKNYQAPEAVKVAPKIEYNHKPVQKHFDSGRDPIHPTAIIQGVQKQKVAAHNNKTEPQYVERQNFHIFSRIPSYPYALQQSGYDGPKRYKYLNREKVIAAAMCHYDEHKSFSQFDLMKTIDGMLTNAKIKPILDNLIAEGHFKSIPVKDRINNPQQNLTLASIPASMTEEDFYKIIKDFRGIPAASQIKAKNVGAPAVISSYTGDTVMDYSVIKPDELATFPEIEQRFESLSHHGSSFLYQFGPLLIPGQGSIKQLNLDENGTSIKAIYLQSTAIVSPPHYIFAQPKYNNNDKLHGTWDDETILPLTPAKDPVRQFRKAEVKIGPSYTALTITTAQAMKLKNDMDNRKTYHNATISQMNGMFSCHLGQVAIPGFGRVTSLDYKSGNAVHLIQFDSYISSLSPQVVFVQSEKLDPDFQRMKYDMMNETKENSGIDGLAVALFKQQAQKVLVLGKQSEQIKAITALTR